MENVDAIVTLINTAGFPIACCCVLFYLFHEMRKTLDSLNQTLIMLDVRMQEMEQDIKELKNVKNL